MPTLCLGDQASLSCHVAPRSTRTGLMSSAAMPRERFDLLRDPIAVLVVLSELQLTCVKSETNGKLLVTPSQLEIIVIAA